VTAMYLAPEMDAGDMIDKVSTPVGEYESYGELYDRLKLLGAELLVRTLKSIEAGTAQRTPQDPALVSYAPPLRREDCPIDWTKPARHIHDQVRGLIPWPCAVTEVGGKRVKVWTYRVTNYPAAGKVEATLIISDGKVIGGDISSTKIDGFSHGFDPARFTAETAAAQAEANTVDRSVPDRIPTQEDALTEAELEGE